MDLRQQTARPEQSRPAGGVLQRACACGKHTANGEGECAECRQKREAGLLQRAAVAPAPDVAPPIVHDVLGSPGQPLDAQTRAFMEPRFGHDFSAVRVHSDGRAAESARTVNALAYTVGSHVAFGAGQYQPGSEAGRRLLAHELAHVVQQGGGAAPARELSIAAPEQPAEHEAVRTAQLFSAEPTAGKISSGSRPVTPNSANIVLARQPRTPGQTSEPAVRQTNTPQVLEAIPIEFVAEPLGPATGPQTGGSTGTSPSGIAATGGLSLHVLASGDLSWLPRADAVRRIGSAEYWSPLVPSRGTITLDRLLNELPRDLAPRIEAELASGQPLSWVRGAGATGVSFTAEELASLPNLARRFNAGQALSEVELSLLARATEIHVSGSTPGSPFASYTRPNFELPINQDNRYRVRVEMPRGNAIDVTQNNAITSRWVRETPNFQEMEFMAVADNQGRIVSVERMSGGTRPGFFMRYSGAIRWGGRILVVAGPAIAAARVATAPEGERLNVAAEEGGSMLGGALGTSLAVGGCIALGIATGGVGLFVCGLVGGGIGGYLGSAAGGNMMRGLQAGGRPCPSCHALQREWEARRSLRTFDLVSFGATRLSGGEAISRDGRAPGTRAITAEEQAQILRWLDSVRRQP